MDQEKNDECYLYVLQGVRLAVGDSIVKVSDTRGGNETWGGWTGRWVPLLIFNGV